MKSLPEDDRTTNQFERLRQRLRKALLWGFSMTLICGVFFLGLFLTKTERFQSLFKSPESIKKQEVFGFAPYWTLSKIGKVDWKSLTTFAYFSLPVSSDGSIPRDSYEWSVFNGEKLKRLMTAASDNKVKRVVTLTQMEASVIEQFLNDRDAWERLSADSVEILKTYGLDGVNIDFEYIPSNNYLKGKLTEFVKSYTDNLNSQLKDPYITVSVLASSVRFNRIYDISALTQITDGVFMMAYDFYYPGSEMIGPSAPLYGYNNGQGPFWYDVSTAVDDFIKVADSKKIILGIGFYGWSYPAYSPAPKTNKVDGTRAQATTNVKAQESPSIQSSPIGGWDDFAKVPWKGYWDNNGWHVVYLEDERSLSHKLDFASKKNLGGIGIWALGYEGNSQLWSMLREQTYN